MKINILIILLFYCSSVELITPGLFLRDFFRSYQLKLRNLPESDPHQTISTTTTTTRYTRPLTTTSTTRTTTTTTTTTPRPPSNNTAYPPRHGFGGGKQDWDWVEVRDGAHLFWWLYYTTARNVSRPTDRPLAIWLQGGPGASSTGMGNFLEIGPLDVREKKRNHTWVQHMNVLFIDSPVGTGFSYVNDTSCFAKNNKQIVDDLLIMLGNFFERLPDFRSVPIHIFGESYGAKVAVELAYRLNREIKNNHSECILKSVTSIDGWISPIDSMLSWAPYLFNLGFIDHGGYHSVTEMVKLTQLELNEGRYENATNLWGVTEEVIRDVTHGISFYNVLIPQEDYHLRIDDRKTTKEGVKSLSMEENKLLMYNTLVQRQEHNWLRQGRDDKKKKEKTDKERLTELMRGKVSKKLNIPDDIVWGSQSHETFDALCKDFMKPKTDCVESLLNDTNINVVIITGQLDLIVATPGTVAWTNRLHWPGRQAYTSSFRHAIIGNDTIVEGYYKKHGCFSFYWINRAGHSVPADNYKAMDYILRRVTKYHIERNRNSTYTLK